MEKQIELDYTKIDIDTPETADVKNDYRCSNMNSLRRSVHENKADRQQRVKGVYLNNTYWGRDNSYRSVQEDETGKLQQIDYEFFKCGHPSDNKSITPEKKQSITYDFQTSEKMLHKFGITVPKNIKKEYCKITKVFLEQCHSSLKSKKTGNCIDFWEEEEEVACEDNK